MKQLIIGLVLTLTVSSTYGIQQVELTNTHKSKYTPAVIEFCYGGYVMYYAYMAFVTKSGKLVSHEIDKHPARYKMRHKNSTRLQHFVPCN